MFPFTKYLKLSAIAVSSLTLCAHGAQAPQHFDIKQLSKTVEDGVVPLPNEIFGALNKYLIRDVVGITLLRLDERYADFHQVAFLAFARADGNLLNAGTNPVKGVWRGRVGADEDAVREKVHLRHGTVRVRRRRPERDRRRRCVDRRAGD